MRLYEGQVLQFPNGDISRITKLDVNGYAFLESMQGVIQGWFAIELISRNAKVLIPRSI
ncbi:MAG: hypothetical protein VKJ46_07845 [Leptolyngbyaceae bacterium]|nr:hypothetical protein [Leptolyngbyaceae bacterium]